MKIGTPLSASATKIMLLGSGELGKEVIISLQRLGIEVIAVDRYPNAPGSHVAHCSFVIDMTDGKKLRELILKVKPDYIIPEIEAIATDILLDIETENIAIVIPQARATQLTMNREGIRTLAAETLKINTSNYAFSESLDQLTAIIHDKIGFPCIVKPVMSSSGKGQSLINNEHDIPKAWEYAISGARVKTSRIIVEQKIDFDFEITLLTVRARNADGDIDTYFCEPIGHRQVDGDYVESWQPQVMNDAVLIQAQQIAKAITNNLGGLGLFGVELFIKDHQVWFSEVSPRPHDTGMVTMITQRQNEFELHAKAILGLPVDVSLFSPGASAVLYGGLDEHAIYFNNIEKALQIPNTDIRLFGKPESFVKRRMGVILATAKTTEIARQNAKKSAALITTSI